MFDMFDPRDEGNEDFFATGDARRCPYHPSVKTSSDDGLFDAPCDLCEGEMYEASKAWDVDPANPHRRYCGNEAPVAVGTFAPRSFMPNRCEPDAEEVPF